MPILLAVSLLIFSTAPEGGDARTRSPGISPEVAATVAGAAAQVRRCYRSPRVSAAARQIVTRLRVHYSSDGMLAELPVIVSQDGITRANQPFASAMAEAAVLAVIRCTPLRLPPERYEGGWDEFELTFSPRAAA